ncbi:MAG TPA: response regulator [Allosphingosinicella sp.]|nr:response regulator [Allosphingosinicella sp.]
MVSPHPIYVVDDDAEARDSIRFLLATLKLDSITFRGGAEFVERLESLPSGCILLDLRMPTIDGLAVQQALVERGLDWPIIFMTGSADTPSVVRALRTGAVEFIEKPFTDEQLLTALHKGFVELKKRQAPPQRAAS